MEEEKQFKIMYHHGRPHIAQGNEIILEFTGELYSYHQLTELIARLNGDYFAKLS